MPLGDGGIMSKHDDRLLGDCWPVDWLDIEIEGISVLRHDQGGGVRRTHYDLPAARMLAEYEARVAAAKQRLRLV